MKVATTVLVNNDKVLLIKKPTNRYSMPGGKTEHLEIPIKTAAREFYEETGLSLNKITLKVVSEITSPQKDFEMYTFFSSKFEGELITDCKEGELEWISISKLGDLEMYPSDLEIIQYCLNNYELLRLSVKY